MKTKKTQIKMMSNTDFNNFFDQFGPDCRYRKCFPMMLKEFIRTTASSGKSRHVGGKNCNSSPSRHEFSRGPLTSAAAYAYVIKTDQEKMRHKNTTGSSEGEALGVGGWGRLGGV